MKKEKRFYLVNVDNTDEETNFMFCSDEEFMIEAENQGTVFTEQGFVNAFNKDDGIASFSQYLRVFEVETTSNNDEDQKFHCPICNGTNVQSKAWVDLNGSEKKIEFYETNDEDDFWCEDCQEHIKPRLG